MSFLVKLLMAINKYSLKISSSFYRRIITQQSSCRLLEFIWFICKSHCSYIIYVSWTLFSLHNFTFYLVTDDMMSLMSIFRAPKMYEKKLNISLDQKLNLRGLETYNTLIKTTKNEVESWNWMIILSQVCLLNWKINIFDRFFNKFSYL